MLHHKLKIEEIAKATSGQILNGDKNAEISDVIIDTRKPHNKETLFVPLKGDRVDGHSFIPAFFSGGGGASIASSTIGGRCIILVRDTKKALGDIAKLYRSKFDVPIVAITGSVGKTSTKEMIALALSKHFGADKVVKTHANFNNEIGLPLTLFNLSPNTQVAVTEMGARAFGDINYLSNIAKQKIAVITNIGTAHIGEFGSRENILKAKMEIANNLPQGGALIINGDDEMLKNAKLPKKLSVIKYGLGLANDVLAKDVEMSDTNCEFIVDDVKFDIPLVGRHNVYNALASVAVAKVLGISVAEVADSLKGIGGDDAIRQKVINAGDYTIIDDTYNAGVESMSAGLEVLMRMAKSGDKEHRAVAILGDMLEKGEFSAAEHAQVGSCCAQNLVDVLITIGKDSAYIAKQAEADGVEDCHHFDTIEHAKGYIKDVVAAGDIVFVKASRGMHFEKVVELLQN
ncbi:MAG: UDP-N-acetylmuramoyl-tripeptide--D-alanyl-D-alanine ligase [Clostridiales bacterium]|jgi:UDP-N-acetylmuramoyl-tripeptide--D-alanyl-D-alanine ligase|nr:UDP-N-acetylmuramoyl-tripeptide--D-alanyl-D-alanine ligase [Clostridiales bacterium]